MHIRKRLTLCGIALAALTWSGSALAQSACAGQYAGEKPPEVVRAALSEKLRELCYRAYVVAHSGLTRTPLWAAEVLTRAEAQLAIDTAGDDYGFRVESRLPSDEQARSADYTNSGFDKGHMVPSGNFGIAADDRATFTLANAVPQHPCLNQRTWRKMEEALLHAAATRPVTFIVTGTLYEQASPPTTNNGGRVAIPNATFKAIHVPGEGAAAYIATNPQTKAEIPVWSVVSIDALTARLGVDVFPALGPITKGTVMSLPIPSEPSSVCNKGR